MTTRRMAKVLIFAAVGLVLFTIVATVGYRSLTRTIHTRLLAALGPEASVEGIEISVRSVTVKNLRIKAKGSPDPLTIERMVVTPSLRSLATSQIQLSDVELERAMAVVTIRSDGKMQVPLGLPTSSPTMAKGDTEGQMEVSVVRVRESRIDLIDHMVKGPPVRLHLEQVQASVRNLAVPLKPEKSPLEFEGLIRGRRSNGHVRLSGWVEPIAQNASVKVQLRAIDLHLLAPYLLTAYEAKVEDGYLDMDLDFHVREGRLNAPGRATLADLRLSSTPGRLNTFMGVPRQAILNFLKTRQGKIELTFRVEGNLNDPHFELQRTVMSAMATGLAEQLGVSVKGVGSGVVRLGKEGADALGSAAHQLGGGLKRLFDK